MTKFENYEALAQSQRFRSLADKLREIRACTNGAYDGLSWEQENQIHQLAEDSIRLLREIQHYTPGLADREPA